MVNANLIFVRGLNIPPIVEWKRRRLGKLAMFTYTYGIYFFHRLASGIGVIALTYKEASRNILL